MKKKLAYILIPVLLILGLGIYFLGGTSHTKSIHLNSDSNSVMFPLPTGNNYHAKVKIKGDLSCDRYVRLLRDSTPVNEPMLLKSGTLNEVIYDHDWYGAELGLLFPPTDEDCKPSKLKIVVTFYN